MLKRFMFEFIFAETTLKQFGSMVAVLPAYDFLHASPPSSIATKPPSLQTLGIVTVRLIVKPVSK